MVTFIPCCQKRNPFFRGRCFGAKEVTATTAVSIYSTILKSHQQMKRKLHQVLNKSMEASRRSSNICNGITPDGSRNFPCPPTLDLNLQCLTTSPKSSNASATSPCFVNSFPRCFNVQYLQPEVTKSLDLFNTVHLASCSRTAFRKLLNQLTMKHSAFTQSPTDAKNNSGTTHLFCF